jgi:hypothetical protein
VSERAEGVGKGCNTQHERGGYFLCLFKSFCVFLKDRLLKSSNL